MNKRHVLSACAGVVLAFNSALAGAGSPCARPELAPDGDTFNTSYMRRDGQHLTGQVVMTCSNRDIVDEYPGKRAIVHDRLQRVWAYVVGDQAQEAKLKQRVEIGLTDSQADVGGSKLAYLLNDPEPTSDQCTTYYDVRGFKEINGRFKQFFGGTMTFCRPY